MDTKSISLNQKKKKQSDALFKAQQYFSLDSSNLVLKGDGQNKGVLYVISTYGGTKAGNLAQILCRRQLPETGRFQQRSKIPERFFNQMQSRSSYWRMVALGDAYSELNKNFRSHLFSIKKQPVTFEKDESNSAEYLFRAALLSEEASGKPTEALALYKELKEKFPKTDKGFQVDKYIYRLSVEKN
jgi:hypothetical protein